MNYGLRGNSYMWTFLMFKVFVVGTVKILREYRFVLEFKKEERLFDEYKKKSTSELNNIMYDTNPDEF